jgi:hypothetical protein
METKGYQSGSMKKPVYWVLCAFIYLGLLYSTSLQNGFGPEKGLTLNYFTTPKTHPPNCNETQFEKFFPDQGILNGTASESIGDNFWKMSGFFGDAGFYVMQADSLALSVPPFKYRFLPTMLVGWASKTLGWRIPNTFTVFNTIVTGITALLFTFFLQRYFRFSQVLALIGGVLFLTMAPSTRTIPFPSLEPSSFLIVMLLFIAAISKNVPLFIISSLAGVATKEVFIVAGVIWLASESSLRKQNLAVSLMMVLLPIAGFALIRYSIGGNPMEVNFGYNIMKGEFPKDYATRLFHPSTLFELAVTVFLSFSFLWVGLINLKKNKFLLRSAIFIPVVVFAAFVLSGQIIRVLGVLFPVVITSFLLFFHRNDTADVVDDMKSEV